MFKKVKITLRVATLRLVVHQYFFFHYQQEPIEKGIKNGSTATMFKSMGDTLVEMKEAEEENEISHKKKMWYVRLAICVLGKETDVTVLKCINDAKKPKPGEITQEHWLATKIVIYKLLMMNLFIHRQDSSYFLHYKRATRSCF